MDSKTISISHGLPLFGNKPYLIVPFGLIYNREVLRLKRNSRIALNENGVMVEKLVVRTQRIPIKSGFFTFMMKSLYGENMTEEEVFRRWETRAILFGNSKNCFSRTECLLIEIRDI